MSKRKMKNKNTAGLEQQETTALENEALPADTAENISKETAVAPSDEANEAHANEEPDGEFAEQNVNEPESEGRKLHERFRFDWELEENILEALDEDASELTETEDETQSEPIRVQSISLAQVAQAFFGLFLLVFSIIGVVATGFKIADFVKAQNDNSEQIKHFEDFLMPLVASDAPMFDGAASLNEDVIITAACWDIIFNPSVYYEYSNGAYSVSYQDIDSRVAKLFGAGLTYTHKSVGDIEMYFEYDEETGMYSIPAYPRSPAYYPEITAITEVEGGYELSVCYKLPITNWIESVDKVEKIMIYTVVPTETDYNVTAIRIGEIGPSEEA